MSLDPRLVFPSCGTSPQQVRTARRRQPTGHRQQAATARHCKWRMQPAQQAACRCVLANRPVATDSWRPGQPANSQGSTELGLQGSNARQMLACSVRPGSRKLPVPCVLAGTGSRKQPQNRSGRDASLYIRLVREVAGIPRRCCVSTRQLAAPVFVVTHTRIAHAAGLRTQTFSCSRRSGCYLMSLGCALRQG
jgi:hypothetical protein